MRASSFFYRLGRLMNNVDAASKPSRTARRVKNIALGKALGKSGAWKIWR